MLWIFYFFLFVVLLVVYMVFLYELGKVVFFVGNVVFFGLYVWFRNRCSWVLGFFVLWVGYFFGRI